MKKVSAVLCFLLGGVANAQNVQQSGSITPNHPTAWVTNGIIKDGGTATNPVFPSFGTVGQGPTICANSGPVTGPYNRLCLSANTASAGQITLNNYGGATAQNLQLCVNSQCLTIPTSAGASTIPTITVPTVTNAFICAADTAGNLKDCAAQTQYGIGYFSTTQLLSSTAAMTDGQFLIGQTGAAPLPRALSGDISSITAGGAVTLGKVNGVPFPASYTTNLPLLYNGSTIAQGTVSGNTTKFLTTDGTLTNGHCLSIDSNVNIVDAGGPCTTSGGGGTVTTATQYQLPYYPANGATVVGFDAVPNAVVSTLGTGQPQESTTLPSGLTIPSPTLTGTITGAVASLNQQTAPVYTSAQSQSGAINLGGGLSLGQQFNFPQIAPWSPVTGNNTLVQTTGTANALRNASFTSWNIMKFMNGDSGSLTYYAGIASFTASIAPGCASFTTSSCSTMTVTGSPTGTLVQFQRVTDATNFTTNATTAAANNTLHFASTTGIAAGMIVEDLTNPSAIPGDLTVSSTTGTTVVLSGTIGSPTIAVDSYTYNSGTGLVTLTIESTSTHNGNNPLPLSAGQTVTVASLNIAGLNGTYALASASNTTLTYTGPTGQVGSPSGGGTFRAAVGSSDTVAFSAIARGTSIIGLGTGTGGAGTYYLSNSQTIASKTMLSAGGWTADGVYVIPVGNAGGSLLCALATEGNGATGNFTPNGGVGCTASGNLTDVIFRFPVDSVDASRFMCDLSQGPSGSCVGTNTQIQPVTFQVYVNYDSNVINTPSLDTKMTSPIGAITLDNFATATTDLPSIAGRQCGSVGTPVQCVQAWTWVPQGVRGGYEVNFHVGPLASGKSIILSGFELKQTPGATCSGTVAPCYQFNPGPLEIPDVVTDINRNKRFTQLVGAGFENNYNSSSRPAVETTSAFALSTTHVLATWNLPVAMRCNTWIVGAKGAKSCPQPNVYYSWAVGGIGDYTFVTNAASFAATAVSVEWYGLNSIMLNSTVSGATAGTPGYVRIGYNNDTGGSTFIMLDTSIIGD